MNASNVRWVKLGDYIELCSERNTKGQFTVDDVMGMTITKEIIPTKADIKDNDLSKFLIVKPGEFVYNPRTHGKKIGLGFNNTDKPFIISWNNIAFRVKNANSLVPQYLYIIICREEWDRNACFRSWGSSTEVFSWNEFTSMIIPLPPIQIQQKLVDTYNGLKSLAEQNEALVGPLSNAAKAYIVHCNNTYKPIGLSSLIEEVNERNFNNVVTLTQGVDVNMEFIPAKREASDKESAKVVQPGQFAFNRVVKAGGTKLPIALRKGPTCIISSSYSVFQNINPQELISEYLFIWMSRSEFHRYCGYISTGTTRDVFDFEDLKSLKIPLPPIEVQQSIVNLYSCLEEAKAIAAEAREKLKTLCPALVQRAANS